MAGINMGDRLLGPAVDNPKGFFEDLDFLTINDAILHKAGGSWDNPPAERSIIDAGKSLSNMISELVARRTDRVCWGWKDPRTALTIRCYMPHLADCKVFFIPCFRKPLEVAKSLNERNGMLLDDGIRLAKIYNQRILEFLNEWQS